jgi:hypothetical protein
LPFRYNLPRSFLKPTGNLLVLLEEENGNPLDVSIDTVSIGNVCGKVGRSHPPRLVSWAGGRNKTRPNNGKKHGRRPKVQLRCPPGRSISRILFASYGDPFGDCQSYAMGSCHSSNSSAIAEKVLLYFNLLNRYMFL